MVVHWNYQLLCQSVQDRHVLFATSAFFCFTMDHIVKTRQNYNVCYLKHLILERNCTETHTLWIMISRLYRLALYVVPNFWVSRNLLSKGQLFVCNLLYLLSCESRNRFCFQTTAIQNFCITKAAMDSPRSLERRHFVWNFFVIKAAMGIVSKSVQIVQVLYPTYPNLCDWEHGASQLFPSWTRIPGRKWVVHGGLNEQEHGT